MPSIKAQEEGKTLGATDLKVKGGTFQV